MYRGNTENPAGFLQNTGTAHSYLGRGGPAAALALSSRRRLFFRGNMGKLPPFEAYWKLDVLLGP